MILYGSLIGSESNKRIEELEIGDLVYDHLGQLVPVLKKAQHNYAGKIYTIQTEASVVKFTPLQVVGITDLPLGKLNVGDFDPVCAKVNELKIGCYLFYQEVDSNLNWGGQVSTQAIVSITVIEAEYRCFYLEVDGYNTFIVERYLLGA